ncbi:MAG: sulfotransferase domain-containing protein [Actinomycetota bacterium]|nr:sulfotransferase domain-containing protein [Actinomycetota bacterium]
MKAAQTTDNARVAAAPGGAQTRAGALPNLIIVGAQKCGTSGLHYHLGLHPEISMSKPKELNFFIEERNWPRGEDWYRRHFDPGAKVRGEASPNYTAFPQHIGVPERMAKLVPDAKLVYLLRDPLERIAAHWVHNFAKRREKGDLASTLAHPNTSYLQRSQYAMQLQQFLNHFPRESIMILDQEDFRKNRAETLRRVFEFSGADPSFTHPGFERERHATARKTRATKLAIRMERASKSRWGKVIPPKLWFALDERLPMKKTIDRPDVGLALTDEALRALRDDAERMRELAGRPFRDWSIWDA